MDIKVNLSVSTVAAVIAGEALSVLWYSDSTPWGRRIGTRHFLTAILADVGLAFILQFITRKYWGVSGIEDAAILAAWLTLLFACLEAPHLIWNARSFSNYCFHILHKFALMFVMCLALYYFRNY